MGNNKQTHFNDTVSFLKALTGTTKVCFDSDILRAEVNRVELTKNEDHIYDRPHRETMIKYFEKKNGKWIDFSFCIAPQISAIIADFKYQCAIFKIS